MWVKEQSFLVSILEWWGEMSVSGWIMDGFLAFSEAQNAKTEDKLPAKKNNL